MEIATALFYIFSSLTLFFAIMVVSVRNPVHAVLCLIAAFFNSAGIFVLLGAEFLAMLLVIVYVGAVAVLFLFVVMMLNINFAKMREGFLRNLPVVLGTAIAFFINLLLVIVAASYSSKVVTGTLPAPTFDDKFTNSHALGTIIYTNYFLAFQLSGVILLVAMLGSIVLTHRKREGVRKQKIANQVARDPKKAIELIKVQTGAGIDVDY